MERDTERSKREKEGWKREMERAGKVEGEGEVKEK